MIFFDEKELKKVAIEADLNMIDLKKVQSKVDGKGIDDMTDEERFIEQQRSIGGSEIADIMYCGFHGFDGRSYVYDRKVAEKPEEITEEKKELFAEGHRCEPLIFKLVESALPEGWSAKLDKQRYRDVERDYLHADYDAILVSPDGEEFVGEIKSYKDFPGKPKLEDGVLGKDVGKHLLSSSGYEWQVRYYMREKNCRAAIIFSHPMENNEEDFTLDKMHTCIIYRDFEKEEKMMNAIDEFWNNNVVKRVRPKFDSFNSQEAFESALSVEQIPFEKDKECEFSKGCIVYLEQYNEIDEDIKTLSQKIEAAKARQRALTLCLVQAMGDAQIGKASKDDVNYRFTRSIKKGVSTFDKKKLFKEHPEINESDYKKIGKESDTFKLDTWLSNKK